MSIFWNRRDRARSLSKYFLYSSYVVEPMHFTFPFDRSGFSMFDASMEPPDTAPAPTTVCISSMKRMTFFIFWSSAMTFFIRSSKSPRNLVPAMREPMSREYIFASLRGRGTSPRAMNWASPSVMAVLPDAGVAHVDRVVLDPAAQHLYGPLDDVFSSDQRVELARLRLRGELGGEGLDRLSAGPFPCPGVRLRFALFLRSRSPASPSGGYWDTPCEM